MVPVSFVNTGILVRWNITLQNEDKWQFHIALWLEASQWPAQLTDAAAANNSQGVMSIVISVHYYRKPDIHKM